jgi:hypothetical protein
VDQNIGPQVGLSWEKINRTRGPNKRSNPDHSYSNALSQEVLGDVAGIAMENLLYDRRLCERRDQKTSWRHFSSVDVAPRKRSCTFFYMIYPKENIVYTGVVQIFYRKNRWDIDNFAFDNNNNDNNLYD